MTKKVVENTFLSKQNLIKPQKVRTEREKLSTCANYDITIWIFLYSSLCNNDVCKWLYSIS